MTHASKRKYTQIEEASVQFLPQFFGLLGPLIPSASYPGYVILGRAFLPVEETQEKTILKLLVTDGKHTRVDVWLIISLTYKTVVSNEKNYSVVHINMPITALHLCYQIVTTLVRQFHYIKLLDRSEVIVSERDLPFDLEKHQQLLIRDIKKLIEESSDIKYSMMEISCKYEMLPIFAFNFWKIHEGKEFLNKYYSIVLKNSIGKVLVNLDLRNNLTDDQGHVSKKIYRQSQPSTPYNSEQEFFHIFESADDQQTDTEEQTPELIPSMYDITIVHMPVNAT